MGGVAAPRPGEGAGVMMGASGASRYKLAPLRDTFEVVNYIINIPARLTFNFTGPIPT